MDTTLQSIGYTIAGVVFLVLALLLVSSFRPRAQNWALLIATILSAAWGGGLAYDSVSTNPSVFRTVVLELSFDGAWLAFLAVLFKGGVSTPQGRFIRLGGVVLVAGLLAISLGLELLASTANGDAASVLVFGSLLTSLFALVNIEQIYRNARRSQLKGLKYLCLGLGGIFAYDLFLYSNTMLTGTVSDIGWAARGFVVAMCVPLLVVAVRRESSWSVGLFVSRHIVFYTATLFGAGVYLLLASFLGYYIGVAGGEWGPLVQLLFFSAAFLALAMLLISGRLRAKLRVFISKHFFENRYDYREEWLRLIDTLTAPEDALPLKKRGIKALAQIVDASAGLLWLRRDEDDHFDCVANWNTQMIESSIPGDSSLPTYLQRTTWVIERSEYDRHPERYDALDLTEVAILLPSFDVVVPLLHEEELLGFVLLIGPNAIPALTFEDRDLLKTAGKQVASYLGQERMTEQLAENRQFEAFNKFTAYVMHDLKNVLAQNTLVVENAERHRDKPEFIDDAMATIKAGVARMQRVIEQLQQSTVDRPTERAELGKLVMKAVSQCADRHPVPRALIGERQVWVRADAERLQMAIYHAIRNAQDATPADGNVTIRLDTSGDQCILSVVDDGRGMDKEFIRDRLFRPFDSTKGNSGMGIGAHQIRETLRMAGGEVRVHSKPGQGTRLEMVLET